MRPGATSETEVRSKLTKLAALANKNIGPAKLRLELVYPTSKVVLNSNHQVELTNEFLRAVQTSGMTGRYE
jgi:hypothetical protein